MPVEDSLPRAVTAPTVPQSVRGYGAKRWIMMMLARLKVGRLVVHLRGERYVAGHSDELQAEIHIHRPWALTLKCLTRGDLGFGQAYLAGDWSSDDVAGVLTLLLRNMPQLGVPHSKYMHTLRFSTRFLHWLRRNTVSNSRKNIAAHYDLGNDFYRAWLDPSMTYSSAWYSQPEASLEQAQVAKYQRILQELDAQPGQHILEIGCGWGGFAEQAAQAGCYVHGITLSSEQLDYAQQRLQAFGSQTQMELRDYRHIEAQYDHIVSIEMFEAVGQQYWTTYFEKLARCLKPGGRAVLQIITICDASFELYRTRPDFIQRYIFPGGMLPSPSSLQSLLAQSGLRQLNLFKFGQDYARTLRLWDDNFVAVWPSLEKLGYDEHFKRMWRYYLAYCEAGFKEERIDVIQWTLEKPA